MWAMLVCLTALTGARAVLADSVDLSTMLADPPTTEWAELSQLPARALGPFTAADYATYAGNPADATDLKDLGFVQGYGRAWVKRDTNDELLERVFQFAPGTGAQTWYAGVRDASETSKYFKADIKMPAELQNSFGVELAEANSYVQYRVDFYVGDFVFVVHTDSLKNDLSQLAIRQALFEFRMAQPSPSPSPSARPTGTPAAGMGHAGGLGISPALVFGVVAGIATVLLVAALVTVFAMTRRRRPAGGVVMSQDGAFWWDGTQWRVSATDPPPASQVSPVARV